MMPLFHTLVTCKRKISGYPECTVFVCLCLKKTATVHNLIYLKHHLLITCSCINLHCKVCFSIIPFHLNDIFCGLVPQNKSQNVILFHTDIFGVNRPEVYFGDIANVLCKATVKIGKLSVRQLL